MSTRDRPRGRPVVCVAVPAGWPRLLLLDWLPLCATVVHPGSPIGTFLMIRNKSRSLLRLITWEAGFPQQALAPAPTANTPSPAKLVWENLKLHFN